MKKQALKTKTERLFPVGFEWQTELSMFAAALIWSSLWGIIGFYNRLSVAFDHIENGGDMLQFYEVLGNAIFWFPSRRLSCWCPSFCTMRTINPAARAFILCDACPTDGSCTAAA